MALDIHMAHTGSFPDLSDEDLIYAKSFLEKRLAHWEEPVNTAVFDSVIRTVLEVAVQEAQLELTRRAEWKQV